MSELLLIWLVLLLALLKFAVGRHGCVGTLTLAYFLGLSLIHVPGVLAFLSPDAAPFDQSVTRLGFEMTLSGMAAFVIGATFARKMRIKNEMKAHTVRQYGHAYSFQGRRAFLLGIAAYFLLLPLSSYIPSLGSVVSGIATLLIIGLWLELYSAVRTGNRYRILLTLVVLPVLPLSTLITAGFLGYGIGWMLSIAAFLYVLTTRRTLIYASAPLIVYIGLSLFVTYAAQRDGIREVVWNQQAGIFARLDRVSSIISDFELFDLESPSQMRALDLRLNQSSFVGIGIMRHESGYSPYLNGETIPLWALIPRAIWTEKPDVGGSGDLVSHFTGIRFARGTSIGVGQVLEFYMNFGWPLVLVGFFAFGFVLMRLDRGIMRCLAAEDMRGLLLRAMPGLTLLQPGGSLLEIIVACAAAYIAAQTILFFPIFGISAPRYARRKIAAAQ